MIRVKLCGLVSVQDAAAASQCRPDFAGMILAPGFRRTVTPETAAAIRQTLDAAIPAVGVFVGAQPDEIAAYANRGIIQYVQLHGSEDAADLRRLRQVCALPVIQAFRIKSADDLEKAAQSEADYILLDSGTGTGERLDWTLLKDFPRPYLLAGGLTPENVAEAVRMLRPFGVDVSSGIETVGRKDAGKMRRFTEAARSI